MESDCLGSCRGLHLDEVVLHVSLEIEVGEFVVGLGLEEGRELGIGDDLATIGLVLEIVGADVTVDLAAHVGACHLTTSGLAKEGGQLVADEGGLDEARGLVVSGSLALLGG